MTKFPLPRGNGASEVDMSKTVSWWITILGLVFLFVANCQKIEDDGSSDGGPDGDVDTDSDSDGDTDSDSDGDSDSDTDADTDSDSDHPSNPLTVDPEDQNCDENATCVAIPTTCPFNSYAAINASAYDKYNEQLKHLCDGILPERPLFTPVAQCAWGNTCMLAGIEPADYAEEIVTACEETEDCVSAFTQCDACECYGIPINADLKNEASAVFGQVCSDYSGGVCDIACEEYPVLTCLDKKCSWID